MKMVIRSGLQLNVTALVNQFSGPTGKVRQVEVCMYCALALISGLVIFGSFRRRTNSGFLSGSITGAFVLSFNLITFTIGQMLPTSINNVFYPIWAVYLVLLYGNPDSITAYSLEDNEQWRRSSLTYVIQMGWMGWVVGSHVHVEYVALGVLTFIMIFVCAWKIAERTDALAFASKSGVIKGTKLIADFMRYEHELGELPADPVHMRGYHYLVTGENAKFVTTSSLQDIERLNITRDEVITIEKVWSCNRKLLSADGDPDSKMKDICLSFALYKLLCCHFAGFPFSQSSLDKQWELIRDGLLQNVENYERPFRVVETELGFLYDHFYTKYALFFRKPLNKLYRFGWIVASSYLIQHLFLTQYEDSYDSQFSEAAGNRKVKHKLDDYVLATNIIMQVVVALEVLQLILFIISNWGKLLFLCKYVEKKSWRDNVLYEQVVRVLCSIPCRNRWGRQLGQYSFFDSFHRRPPRLMYNYITRDLFDNPGKGYGGCTFVKLPPDLQVAVLVWIKRNGRRFAKGIESLNANGVKSEELFLACKYNTTTQVIMVWHLATRLCEIQHRRPSKEKSIAMILSKYCAYLVVFSPRLLPDHSYVTECTFKKTVKEAEKLLKGYYKSTERKYSRIRALADVLTPLQNMSTIEASARVSKLLVEEVGDDVDRMWRMLADFWTEMLLFIAPSDDLSAHAEHLAQGGEFITHLWTLLFHAGIVKRDHIDDVCI